MIDDMTSNRIVVFHMTHPGDECIVEQNMLDSQLFSINSTYAFVLNGVVKPDNIDQNNWIEFPKSANTSPKQKNFIIDWCKSQNFKGFLHIIESNIKVNLSTKAYMNQLENTMKVLDYDIHFSTATDRCNYLFNKFCPRLTLHVDDDIIKQKLSLPDSIFFTSHSNVSYVTYNFGNVADCPPKFDERFSIGMFYIIEFLSRRRATRRDDQLYYMNQYLSISGEVGAYDMLEEKSQNQQIDEQAMKDENELFKSMNIDYTPDNNIDAILDVFYKKIKSKISS